MVMDFKDEMNWLMMGDCLERMKEIPDGSIDMILCDPPYGTTACKWDSVIPLEKMWEQLKRVVKPNGAIVITAAQPFTSNLIMSNIKMFKYCWVWEKEKATGFAFSGKQPMRKTEDICVFYTKQPFYDSKGELLDKPYRHTLPISKSDVMNHMPSTEDTSGVRRYAEYTHAKKHNIIKISRDNANKGVHPTQKPVALMEYLIRTYTDEGDTVLDNCMGSGTTGVASKNLGRKFIGIEMDENYYNIAKNRILGEV